MTAMERPAGMQRKNPRAPDTKTSGRPWLQVTMALRAAGSSTAVAEVEVGGALLHAEEIEPGRRVGDKFHAFDQAGANGVRGAAGDLRREREKQFVHGARGEEFAEERRAALVQQAANSKLRAEQFQDGGRGDEARGRERFDFDRGEVLRAAAGEFLLAGGSGEDDGAYVGRLENGSRQIEAAAGGDDEDGRVVARVQDVLTIIAKEIFGVGIGIR